MRASAKFLVEVGIIFYFKEFLAGFLSVARLRHNTWSDVGPNACKATLARCFKAEKEEPRTGKSIELAGAPDGQAQDRAH